MAGNSHTNNRNIRWVTWLIFISYTLFLCFKLFIDGPFRFANGNRSYNLYPFKTISTMISNYNFVPNVVLINIAGNIAAFIPLGFLAPIIFRRTVKLRQIALTGAVVSLAAELIQIILARGAFDIDDIFLNIVGTIFGFLLFKIFLQKRTRAMDFSA